MTELIAFIAEAPWQAMAPFIVIGLLSQLVDGALGAGYGMVSNTLLVALGMPPATASAATHSIESFTSAASGLSHAFQRNVDWLLFARLAIPGIIGGLLGVWLLSIMSLSILQPILLVYLGAIGTLVLWMAPRRAQSFRTPGHARKIAFAGGILDATGGGWGAVVAGSLVAQGLTPRTAIGTTNAAEFFVTVTILAALVGNLGLETISLAVSGLLVGGLLGTPFSAWLTRRLPSKLLAYLVGALLVVLSISGMLALIFQPGAMFPRF